MANFKRKKPKAKTFPKHDKRRGGFWLNSWPAWHDVLYHRRPVRRDTAGIERAIMAGADAEAVIWPRNKRPHAYYW
ncbi:hypothetical protein [Methylocella sp. CPCC 101449]|uniref:hypothetical protein n=1 Tax=Methylocella sp. CPCC 101449 TaxID=2987531 RepID=UPI0028910045|nr:hypothetical protein [Methylocella sp. CPCC 101449]MDT2022017.1 hypothetical protein [Methylocella sp. CPCC 101449]